MPGPIKRPDRVEDESFAVAQLIKSLLNLDTKLLKAISDIDDNEILTLALLFSWAKHTSNKIISDVCNEFLSLRLSRFRLGRREVSLVASLVSGGVLPMGRKGFKDLLNIRI